MFHPSTWSVSYFPYIYKNILAVFEFQYLSSSLFLVKREKRGNWKTKTLFSLRKKKRGTYIVWVYWSEGRNIYKVIYPSYRDGGDPTPLRSILLLSTRGECEEHEQQQQQNVHVGCQEHHYSSISFVFQWISIISRMLWPTNGSDQAKEHLAVEWGRKKEKA